MRRWTMFLTAMLAVVVTLASCESEPGSYEPTNNNPNPTADVVDEPGEDIQSQPEVAVPANLCGGEECNEGEECWNQQCCTPAEAAYGRQLFADIPGVWGLEQSQVSLRPATEQYPEMFAVFGGALATLPTWTILPDGTFYYEYHVNGIKESVRGKFFYPDNAILAVSCQFFNAEGNAYGDSDTIPRIR